ncbi:S8 family serine peptidase [Massilia sp. B-10]|nr:S8 family serine peptidase [Massilia sp. B-10]
MPAIRAIRPPAPVRRRRAIVDLQLARYPRGLSTIAAKTNNGSGVAGVAFNAKIVPVRVLGKCGGYTSDIADAIIWASGGSVA